MLRGRGRGGREGKREPFCLLFGWSTSSTGGRLLTSLLVVWVVYQQYGR